MSETGLIQVVIQGGAVGVAIFTLIVLYKLLCLGTSMVNNHMGDIMTALGSIGAKLDRLISLSEKKDEN